MSYVKARDKPRPERLPLVASGRPAYMPSQSDVMEIEPQELWDKRKDVVIVDVRQPDEWEGELGHIPGARHIALNTLPERIEEIPADKMVVFVCRSGGRSGRACAFAMEHGLEKVYNLK